MSKPKDPVIAVIDYFETAELPLAKQTLAIVTRSLRRRGAGTVASPINRAPRKRAQPAAATAADATHE